MEERRSDGAQKLQRVRNDSAVGLHKVVGKSRERARYANVTIDFYLLLTPFSIRILLPRGGRSRVARKMEEREGMRGRLKGMHESLNPLNARNNLRSVPSTTIFFGSFFFVQVVPLSPLSLLLSTARNRPRALSIIPRRVTRRDVIETRQIHT